MLKNVCTDNKTSCDIRDHSDWLRVILGHKSVQLFYSAIIFKENVPTQVQWYRWLALKMWSLPKRYISLGLMTKIL